MADAITAALTAVRTAERAEGLRAEPGDFHLTERTAYRHGVDGLNLLRLADPLAQSVLRQPAPRRLVLDCRSAVVVTSKFCLPAQVKARAYLVHDGQPLTLKVWRSAPGQRDLGRTERDVRSTVAAIPEFRSPPVLASGHADGVDYLLERVAYGRHPQPGAERVAAAEDLVPALAAAYQRHGLTEWRLSRIVHPEFTGRLTGVLAEVDWDPVWGPRHELLRRLRGLVDRNDSLPCSLGHGDLVASNIIRTDDGRHTLIDWEFAKLRPVAFDLGKLLFASGDPAAVTGRVADALHPFNGRGLRRYRWPEQLALGVAQLLSWGADRRERARAAGLLRFYERELAQRISWLAALLDDS